MMKSRLRLVIFLAVLVTSLVLVPASAASSWNFVDYDEGYDSGTYDSYLFYLSSDDGIIEAFCADYFQYVDQYNDIGKAFYATDTSILSLNDDELALLRAILLDNNPTGLDYDKVIVAKQLAIWEITNGIMAVNPIPDDDIADEIDRLLSLPGVPEAEIYPLEVSRTDNLDGTTTLVYDIVTSGGASYDHHEVMQGSEPVSASLAGNKLTFTIENDFSYTVMLYGICPNQLTVFMPETAGIQPFIGLAQGDVTGGDEGYIEPADYERVILRKDVNNVTDDPTEFKIKFTNQDSGASVVKTIREGSDLAVDLPVGIYKVEEIDIPSRYSLVSIQPEILVVESHAYTYFSTETSYDGDDTPVVTVTNKRNSESTAPTSSNTSTVQYKLEISVEGPGSVLPGAGTYTHNAGTIQMISISGDAEFLGWFGENGSEVYAAGDLYGIAMNSDKKIVARFATSGDESAEEPVPTAEPAEEPAAEPADEANTEIADDAVPQNAGELPKTGGLPSALLYMAGGASILSGLVLSRGKKKK